jgi:hypothetical protein
MNQRLIALAARRTALVARAAEQRDALAQAAGPIRTACHVADQGIAVGTYLKLHPLLLTGVVAAMAVWRPVFILKWLKRGFVAWRIALGLKRMVSNQ